MHKKIETFENELNERRLIDATVSNGKEVTQNDDAYCEKDNEVEEDHSRNWSKKWPPIPQEVWTDAPAIGWGKNNKP